MTTKYVIVSTGGSVNALLNEEETSYVPVGVLAADVYTLGSLRGLAENSLDPGNTYITMNDADTSSFRLMSGVADGASGVAYSFDTTLPLATAGAKLVSIKNNNTEKFYIDKDGIIGVGKLATGSIPAPSAGNEGSIVYDDTTNTLKVSDGASWSTVGGAGVSLAAIGASPNANAATLTGSVLNLEPANASFGGIVTTSAQTFAGAKTFNSQIVATAGVALDAASNARITSPSSGYINIAVMNGVARWQFTANELFPFQHEAQRIGDPALRLSTIYSKDGNYSGAMTVGGGGGLGASYATPAFRIPTAGQSGSYLFQLGGTAVDDWEFAIGQQFGAPTLHSRAQPIYVALANGQALAPMTTLINPLGTNTNRWTTVYSQNGDFSGTVIVSVGIDVGAGAYFVAQKHLGRFNEGVALAGRIPDGGSAIGVTVNNEIAFTTAGAKILSIQNNSVEKSWVDKDGIIGVGKLATGSIPAAAAGNEGAIVYDDTLNVIKFSTGAVWTQLATGTSTDVTLAAIGSTPNANGATLTGQVLNLEPASASFGGVVTTGAQTFAGAKRGAVTALTSSAASIAIDLAVNNNFSHTLTEDTTLAAPSNPVAGQSGVIVFTQHASSPKTLAYNSFWKFPGGTVPTLTATNSAVDVFAYYVESATRATCQLLTDVK